MATCLGVTTGTHTKGAGSTYTIPIPAAVAGSLVVIYLAGGAVPSSVHLTGSGGPAMTRRTPTYSGGSQDTSIWDVTAVGGETAVYVDLGSGDDNLSHIVYRLAAGLTYVGGSHNGSGAGSDVATDYQIKPDGVTVTGPSLIVSGHSADTTTPFGVGNRWRQLGPAGHVYGSGGNQPGNGGVNLVWQSGLIDVDATHSYPQQLAAGEYQATSVWMGSGTCYAVQAIYADTSGVPTNPAVSETVRENSLPGTHYTHWYLSTGTNATIAGYTNKASYHPGDTVEFLVDSTGNPYRVEIYRLGDYGFEVFSGRNVLGCQGGYLTGTVVSQPSPTVDPVLGSTSCAWTSTATWTIPSDAASGQYYVLVRRTDDTSQVASLDFIVSGDPTGRVAVCLPDFTRAAYNVWGATTDHGPRGSGGTWTGRSLYQAGADGALADFTHRAYATSFDRPSGIQESQASTYLTDAEQGTIAFMEAQGYDLAYVSNFDLDADPALLKQATAVVLLGHHEYWTTNVYDAVQAARDVGVNLIIQSSNTALWHVRFASSDVDRRTMICYKDSGTEDEGSGWSGTGYDPVSYTGTWRDTRRNPGTVYNLDIRSEDSLTGQLFAASGPLQTTMQVPFSAKGFPIWRNSASIQALTSGEYTTIVNALGYEADYPSAAPTQPDNLVNLNPYDASWTTGANAAGTVYDTTGTETLGFTLYRHDSGSLVFTTGSWRGLWSISRWQGGIAGNSVDPNWQNAALCIFHDLGVAPANLREMQPGIDTPLTDPAVGATVGGRNAIARAYGLKAPAGSAFLTFFL